MAVRSVSIIIGFAHRDSLCNQSGVRRNENTALVRPAAPVICVAKKAGLVPPTLAPAAPEDAHSRGRAVRQKQGCCGEAHRAAWRSGRPAGSPFRGSSPLPDREPPERAVARPTAHTEAPSKHDLLWETLRLRKRPGAARTVDRVDVRRDPEVEDELDLAGAVRSGHSIEHS
jgi:hypothetical protein